MKIGASIVGGTGFGAGELLRLLVFHPNVSVVEVISNSKRGEHIEESHPHLKGFYPGNFEDKLSIDKLSGFDKKIVFYTLPHGVSSDAISKSFDELSKENVSVIDLSGDFRLQDERIHKTFYPESPFASDIRGNFTYGISELFKEEISKASHISNPGCFATAISLGFAPLIDLIEENTFSVTALTGSSGAGKSLKESTHHPVRRSNVSAYKVFSHQHEPEIVQALSYFGFKAKTVPFIPLSAPVSRGIFASIASHLKTGVLESKILEKFKTFYENSPFIRIVKTSELENVIGTNFVDISIDVARGKVSINVSMDNLVKGMAGQAIQNMNIMLGLNEKLGLWHPSVRPV